jgi:hypothetical protein
MQRSYERDWEDRTSERAGNSRACTEGHVKRAGEIVLMTLLVLWAAATPVSGQEALQEFRSVDGTSVPQAPPDSVLFAHVVDFHADRRVAGVLRVDPRPIDAAARLEDLSREKLLRPGEALAAARESHLKARGIEVADVAADFPCALTRGTPPPPPADGDPARSGRATVDLPKRCQDLGYFRTLAVSPPQRFEGEPRQEWAFVPAEVWVVRTIYLSPFARSVRDIYVGQHVCSGAWEVLERRFVEGMAS